MLSPVLTVVTAAADVFSFGSGFLGLWWWAVASLVAPSTLPSSLGGYLDGQQPRGREEHG